MTFVTIPAGTFMMGSDSWEAFRDDRGGPQHRVTISKAFEMQTTEVTQSQWASVMGSNPSNFKKSENCPLEFTAVGAITMCPNNPVDRVSWDDAQEFIYKLNAKADGYQYRLPTEAEWEYSARAGSTGPYGVSGNLTDFAWYKDNSGGMTHPVGKKQATAWGLYDMHGNVWEWTADWYGNYSPSQGRDPVGPSSGHGRVIRGGSWDVTSQYCFSANRYDASPHDYVDYNLGFRLVRSKL
jgi:formylglycine-generating enzyme required for sulfatase activity